MEPFRLVCPNCHGKLVIRDEWMLGKSIHCPRCKTVIALPEKRPEGPEPTVGKQVKPIANYDSSALTRVDDGSLAKQVADELATHDGGLSELDDQAIASAIDAFRNIDEHDWQTNVASSESRYSGAASEQFSASSDSATESSLATGAMDWNSPATKRRRQLLMIAMAGVAGLLLALGGLAAFIAARSGTQSKIAIQEPGKEALPDVAPVEAKPEEPLETVTQPSVNPPEKAPGPPVEMPAETMKPTEAPTTTGEPTSPISPEPEPSTGVPQPTPPVAEPPLGVPAGNEATNELPEAMQRFLGVFDVSKVPLLSDALTKENAAEEPRERIDVESLYHPPSIELPSWESAKDRTVYAMTLAEQPVDKFLIRLGQLTGVPIGWDIEQSRFTAIQAHSKIGLTTERSSLGELLEPTLKKLGIVVGTDANGAALLRTKAESLKEKLPHDWSIDDLCSEAASEPLWKDLMLRFFKPSSSHWRIEGRKIVWSDDATFLEHATVAAFLDQIRRANGLKPKSTLPDEVCDPTLGLNELDKRLAKPDTRILLEPDSVAKIFHDAARDADMQFAFDWPALYGHGFTFAVSDTVLLRGRTWPEITRKTLDKFSLVAVADSPNCMVLTTLPRQRRMWRTIIVNAQGSTSKEKLVDRFRNLAPVDADGRSMLIVEFVPTAKVNDAPRWAAVRICPPSTFQLQDRDIREALELPAKR